LTTNENQFSLGLHSVRPSGNECKTFFKHNIKDFFMETKKVSYRVAQKQKPALTVKTGVKAGPEIIIKRNN
jgi:hypothetical protein